jgi:hypothetical protein
MWINHGSHKCYAGTVSLFASAGAALATWPSCSPLSPESPTTGCKHKLPYWALRFLATLSWERNDRAETGVVKF